jgi:hypothetical protein
MPGSAVADNDRTRSKQRNEKHQVQTGKVMKLPKQVAPVERSLTPAAMSGQTGVEASAWYDDILDVAKTVAPIAAPFVTSLI